MSEFNTLEAKKNKPNVTEPLRTIVRTCPMFDETYAYKAKAYPIIQQKFRDFIKTKMENPMNPYGSRDRSGVSGDPMRDVLPNIRHAHLTPDLSVFYAIGGSNPKYVDLFGIFSHDDVGMGQPPKPNLTKQAAKKLQTQIPQLKSMA